jgi:N-acetylneuraminic acid mutarotase
MARLALSALTAAALLSVAAGSGAGWTTGAPLPVPRSEVAAAVLGDEIVVVGGFLRDGRSSSRVDAYSPAGDRWRRLPNLPVGVNHAMAAASGGRLYVVGGYGESDKLRTAFVLERGAWRALSRLPEERAAAGAAVVRGMLVVVGGVGPAGLAREALALDLRTGRWSRLPGPTPREHLGVAALEGRIYAAGGRTGGLDTNLDLVESFSLGSARWRSHASLPDARGGTGLAAAGAVLVSVGGEGPEGTIAPVYALEPRSRRWRRLADLPTPRHGLAVVALGGRVYAIAGGKRPGLFVSSTTESLPIAKRLTSGLAPGREKGVDVGLLDKMKAGAEQAAAMAKSGAEKAKEELDEAKTKRELARAYGELGQSAFDLLERGELAHLELTPAAERIRTLKAELEAGEPGSSAVASTAGEPVSGATEAPPSTPPPA